MMGFNPFADNCDDIQDYNGSTADWIYNNTGKGKVMPERDFSSAIAAYTTHQTCHQQQSTTDKRPFDTDAQQNGKPHPK